MVNDGVSRWGCAKGVTVSTSYHFPVTLLFREIARTWWKEEEKEEGVKETYCIFPFGCFPSAAALVFSILKDTNTRVRLLLLITY